MTKKSKTLWNINFVIKYKTGKEILTFGNIEIEKNKSHKGPIFLKDVDFEKVLVSKKNYSGKRNYKYFISYLYDEYKVKTLHTILAKTSAYVKCHDGQTKWMYFLIKNNDLLEKYNTIWDKVSVDIKNVFDSELVYNKKI